MADPNVDRPYLPLPEDLSPCPTFGGFPDQKSYDAALKRAMEETLKDQKEGKKIEYTPLSDILALDEGIMREFKAYLEHERAERASIRVRKKEGSPEEVTEVLDALKMENMVPQGQEKKKKEHFESNICGGEYYADACSNPGQYVCKGCNMMQYCSRRCQKKHWPDHKYSCDKWRSISDLTPLQAGELLTINMMVDHDMVATVVPYWKYKEKDMLMTVVNFQAPGGLTALMTAAKLDRPQDVHLLITHGSKLDAQSKDGFSALMIAIINGGKNSVEISEKLIDAGADVNLQDNDGDCALIYAAMKGLDKLVSKLINAGANANMVGYLGFTAMIWAAQEGHDTVVRHLFNGGADVDMVNNEHESALILASKNGRTEVIKTLLLAKANVDQISKNHETPLIWAASNGHTATAIALIEGGANLEIQHADDGNTALCIAASNGRLEILEVLLEKGANFDSRNLIGTTPLMWACSLGQFDVVVKLVEVGADLNCQNRFGLTALMIAAEGGYTDVCLALINAGANMNLRDERGYTALVKAIRETSANHVQIAIYLINKGIDVAIYHQGEGTVRDIAAAVNNTTVVKVLDALSTDDVFGRMVLNPES
jgi:uncharacterized protein